MQEFDWQCEPQATDFVHKILKDYIDKNPFLISFQSDLLEKTSTRLFDWIDFVSVEHPLELAKWGFVEKEAHVFIHPGAMLPKIVVGKARLGIKVESVADFLMVHQLQKDIDGSFLSPCRYVELSDEIAVYERHGSQAIEAIDCDERYPTLYLRCQELWQTRDRADFDQALFLAQKLSKILGTGPAAHIVLSVERSYWQAKNRAGALQKLRQDSMGLGWANHDHHTFRSSRVNFAKLVTLFETLGFHCRERYYAGEKAGWGAQLMENPDASLVLFLDVDLTPDEVAVDFAHHPLAEKHELKTVGLWCALHGDSIQEAGMHHLEAQFSFDHLRDDLKGAGVEMMAPFTDFPYLRQAFTKGEVWKVSPHRIEMLLQKGQITKEQANKFLKEGALGSHLENLERHQGYKGFNKEGVDQILRRTDPRHTLQF